MRPFTGLDELHFQAAVGWLELGNWREANEELEDITPQMPAHPDVLAVRWQIYAQAVREVLAFSPPKGNKFANRRLKGSAA